VRRCSVLGETPGVYYLLLHPSVCWVAKELPALLSSPLLIVSSRFVSNLPNTLTIQEPIRPLTLSLSPQAHTRARTTPLTAHTLPTPTPTQASIPTTIPEPQLHQPKNLGSIEIEWITSSRTPASVVQEVRWKVRSCGSCGPGL
jgi:hypothetical protein